jgi:hypothetical protein
VLLFNGSNQQYTLKTKRMWDLGSWFESLPTSQGFGGFYGTVMGHSPGCSSDIDDLLTDWDYFWMIVKHTFYKSYS